ncbi:MAG: AMP-binding protein [Clostridiales bacterium]|nr:AMP-binding protein [Clostridiales bacterium]MDD6389784.1 AMP-binding protein [Bacillota bacterium]
MNFGENLKIFLSKNNMTMTALSKKTGITYNMIKKYCAEEADPTISYALKIAEVLETSLDELMNYTPKRKTTMFQDVFERDFTYIEGFMRSVRRFQDREALVDPAADRTWTYAQLNEDVNRLANALIDRSVKTGDVVFYQLPNSPEFIFAYLAPQKFGAVTSPANFNFSPAETAVCLETSRPKVYIYDASIASMAVKAIEASGSKPDIIIMTGEGELPEGHVRYEEFIKGYPSSEPEVDFVPNIYSEVMRLYTSGTTGKPKGVPVLNANEVLTAHDVIMHFPMNSTDTTMNTTPWFHRGGIHSGGPGPTFYAGGRVVIMKSFAPKLALKYTQQYGVTFLIGVPSIMKMLVRQQERYDADLSSLKGIVTMGAPFERADCIRIHEVLTPNIYNGYGTTETFWNTFLRPYELPEMAGTAGRACTDDDVRVVRVYEDRKASPDDLAAMDDTEVGEVIIRTPKSSYSYFNNPEEEANKFSEGWMYTGDLATWDRHQFISIAGRKDDMIISGGENIYPPIIEEALNSHPKVSSSAVTSVPDKVRGEAVVAYIVPADESLTVSEMVDYCNNSDMLSAFKRPRFYRFVKELPMTATGKLQHYIVQEMALSDLESGLLKLAVKSDR